MKKRITILALLLFCTTFFTSLVSGEDKDEQPWWKLDDGIKFIPSFSGGNMQGNLNLTWSGTFNLRHDRWVFQVGSKGRVMYMDEGENPWEYVFSGGFGYALGDGAEITLWNDWSRIMNYGSHGQVRGNLLLFPAKWIMVNFDAGYPITGKFVISESDPYTSLVERDGRYYNVTVKTRMVTFAVINASLDITLLFDPVDIKFGGMLAEYNIWSLDVGATVKIFSWLDFFLNGIWMNADNAVGLFTGGDYKAIEAGFNIELPARKKAPKTKPIVTSVTSRWNGVYYIKEPVVVKKQETIITEEETDCIQHTAELVLKDKKTREIIKNGDEICKDTIVIYEITARCGNPFNIQLEICDGTIYDFPESDGFVTGEHTFNNTGQFCTVAVSQNSRNDVKIAKQCNTVIECNGDDDECVYPKVPTLEAEKYIIEKGDSTRLWWEIQFSGIEGSTKTQWLKNLNTGHEFKNIEPVDDIVVSPLVTTTYKVFGREKYPDGSICEKFRDIKISVNEPHGDCGKPSTDWLQCKLINPSNVLGWAEEHVLLDGQSSVGKLKVLKKYDGLTGKCIEAKHNAKILVIKSGTNSTHFFDVVKGRTYCTCNNKDASNAVYIVCK